MSGSRSKRRRRKLKRSAAVVSAESHAPVPAPAELPFFGWALAAVIALAGLVRLAATWNDLWIDEIWTVNLVRNLDSPLKVFTLRHDNNHILNSLFVYELRPFGVDWLYRVPVWLAGVSIVSLGAWIAWLGDDGLEGRDAAPKTRALTAAILLAGSYLLVHYGSEARGYSLAIAFGLLAVGTAVADGLRPLSRRAPVAWIALVLAILAHALAVHFLVALIAWSAIRTLRRGGWRDAAATLAWWYALPVGAFVMYYQGFLRILKVGGGPQEGALRPLARAVAGVTGLPEGVPALILLGFAIVVTALGVFWLMARRSDLWALYLVGIVVSPVFLSLFHKTNLYAERYFLVSAIFWLLLAARLLAWLTTRGRAAKAVVAVTLAAFLLGNALWTVQLLRDGRGHFRDALSYMADNTQGATVRVTSDHDFRNRMVVEYYAPPIDSRVRYVSRRERALVGTDWYIASLPRRPGETSLLTDSRGVAYRFETEFPANPFSGLPWRLYRRAVSARAIGNPG